MIHTDSYTIITLLLAATLVIVGVEMLFKHIPKNEEFAKLRMLRGFVVSAYLAAGVFAIIEFIFWRKFHFETAAFLNLSAAAYQFVFCTAAITTCFNPAFTSMRKVLLWLGITSAWVVPLSVLNLMGFSWVVYVALAAYVVQLSVGGVLFYRNYREGMRLIAATDSKNIIHLGRIKMGTLYMFIFSASVVVVSCLPVIAHIIFTTLIIIGYIWFATRFNALSDRIYREYLPVLAEAGLSDLNPEQALNFQNHEERCRMAVERWVAEKGYTKGDLSREETAKDMGLSEDDLKWYFAVCLKEDMRSWRVNLRIELAKEILENNPDAPINELAKSVGFQSRNNIYSYFKKCYGMTPRKYGIQMQQKDTQ